MPKTRKWQCPHCLENSRVEHIGPDGYLTRVLALLGDRDDVRQIDIGPDGRVSWHANPFLS